MTTTSKSLLALFAALTITALGFSEPQKWQVKAFEKFDANSDNALSESEYIAQRVFADKNNAKKNNRAPDEAKATAQAKRVFPKADKDGNGKLSAKEFYGSQNAGKKKK